MPTLRHSGLLVAGDEEQYVASCYRVLRCPQAQESQQPGIRAQQPGKLLATSQVKRQKDVKSTRLVHPRQRVVRNSLSSTDDAHDRRGTGDPLLRTVIGTLRLRH